MFDLDLIDLLFPREAPTLVPPPPPRPAVTVDQLVARGTSTVRVGEKYYKITAKEVEWTGR